MPTVKKTTQKTAKKTATKVKAAAPKKTPAKTTPKAVKEPTPVQMPVTTNPLQTSEGKPKPTITAPYKVDISRGEYKTRLSDEWFRRPDDQRFTSFNELAAFIASRRARSIETEIHSDEIGLKPNGDLLLTIPGHETPFKPTHYVANQLCQLAGIPQTFLRKLTPETAATVFQECLNQIKHEKVKALSYESETGIPNELAAITSSTYGRIWDEDIVNLVRYIIQVDSRWKVPGEMNWSTMEMNPNVNVTKDNTTLFASDRDIFIALFQDNDPIEAGKTAKGEPDYYFKGFWTFNSETGYSKAGMATMMLRGVCMNRTLWGVEGFNEIVCKHSKNGPARFEREANTQVRKLNEGDPINFVRLLEAARTKTLAHDDEEALNVLAKAKFARKDAEQIVDLSIKEEDTPLRSAYDFTQATTAFARSIPNQDKRTTVERTATSFLAAAA